MAIADIFFDFPIKYVDNNLKSLNTENDLHKELIDIVDNLCC
jgi:hypothetical protein